MTEKPDKSEEQVLVTKNLASIHPISRVELYNFETDYVHLSPHDKEWEKSVLSNCSFVPRWMAERDSSIVQLIPYVICVTKDNKILSYRRKGGGEGRLEGKRSIGIGGHINYADNLAVNRNIKTITWNTILFGAAREVEEELGIDKTDIAKNLVEVGLIYTPLDGKDKCITYSTPPVGAVHLGIIFILGIDDSVSVKDSEGLISPKFLAKTPKNLNTYETWSKMILEVIDDIL